MLHLSQVQFSWLMIAIFWGGVELILVLSDRKLVPDVEVRESHSEFLVWLVISISLITAFIFKNLQLFPLPLSYNAHQYAGLSFVLLGLLIRFYAVYNLGRLFNTRISIRKSHRLVTHGLYRFVRHPSYSGLICSFAGVGVAMGDLLSILFLLVPLYVALIKRVKIEERVLLHRFGSDFERYRRKTSCFIPGIF